jgi:hypothetical protein
MTCGCTHPGPLEQPNYAERRAQRDTESARQGLRLLVTPETIALAPRHRPAPLGGAVHARQARTAGDPPEHQGPRPPAGPGTPRMGYRRIHGELAGLGVKVAAPAV